MNRYGTMINVKTLAMTVALCFGVMAAAAPGAIISGSYADDTPVVAYDLTAIGTADWAYWNTPANPASAAATNKKQGVTQLISAIFRVGGSGVRGSSASSQPPHGFTFTDGVSPASGTVNAATGLFNTSLDTSGAGVGLGVILPTASPYTVTVWVSRYVGSGRFMATLPGATNYVHVSTPGTPDDKLGSIYTLTVTPDAANNVLGIQYVLDANTGAGNEHTIISAVAVSEIPEPVTLMLLGVGAMSVVRRRA